MTLHEGNRLLSAPCGLTQIHRCIFSIPVVIRLSIVSKQGMPVDSLSIQPIFIFTDSMLQIMPGTQTIDKFVITVFATLLISIPCGRNMKFSDITETDVRYLLRGIKSKAEKPSDVCLVKEDSAPYGYKPTRISKKGQKICDEMMTKIIEVLEENHI